MEPIQKLGENRGPNYFLIALLFLIPILLFVAGLALFFAGPPSSVSYECEAVRFAGAAEIYSHKSRRWVQVTRKMPRKFTFYSRDRIRTGPEADIDLKIAGDLDLRLKQSSELEVLPKKRGSSDKNLQLKLHRGSLLGMDGSELKDREILIHASELLAQLRGTNFLLQVNRKDQSSTVHVLDGGAEVRARYANRGVAVKALETLTVPKGKKGQWDKMAVLIPRRVNYQEWRAASEVRELTGITPEEARQQVDLRKMAGSLFHFVFDEGVFYKPNWGYANREFYKDELENSILLRLDYDVYPQSSFSGMYFKVRDLDLSKVSRLSFNAKAIEGKPLPEQFRIEFKDQLSIVRGFAVKPMTHDWRFYSFDFNAQKPTPVSEMVLVFENTRVGPLSTSGTVYLKDLNIE